jgi:hypothetical protein
VSDLEDRLRDALATGAAGAPPADGLVEAARSRSRSRRRGWVLAACAAVLVTVATPVALNLASSGDGRDTATPVGTMRTETWHDVQISVPDTWGYGNLSTWCTGARGSTPTPVVERPGGAVESIDCREPDASYGVQFLPVTDISPEVPLRQYTWGQTRAERAYPNGAWVGDIALGHVGVRVVARDEETARAVLGSAELLEGVDDNGCAPRMADAVPGRARMSVCSYGGDGWLSRSEQLSDVDTAAALTALNQAPVLNDQPPCAATPERETFDTVLMSVSRATYRVVWDRACESDRGVFTDSGQQRGLTADVMYWALQPGWSGSVDGSVPLPEVLRR